MAETQGGLCLGHGVGSLDDVEQQVLLRKGHLVFCLWGVGKTKIPIEVAAVPEFHEFLVGEQREKGVVAIMTLHVVGDIVDGAHQFAGIHMCLYPILVVEEGLHEPVGMSRFILSLHLTGFHVEFPHLIGLRGIHIVHCGTAGLVVNACGGVGSGEFLTLCHHREDGTHRGGAYGIDGHILHLEDFGEVFCHALSYAMVLTLTDRGEVTEMVLGGLIERVEFHQCLLTQEGEFAGVPGFCQSLHRHAVVTVVEQPA